VLKFPEIVLPKFRTARSASFITIVAKPPVAEWEGPVSAADVANRILIEMGRMPGFESFLNIFFHIINFARQTAFATHGGI